MHFLCFVVFGHIFSHDFAPDDERTIEGGEKTQTDGRASNFFFRAFFFFFVPRCISALFTSERWEPFKLRALGSGFVRPPWRIARTALCMMHGVHPATTSEGLTSSPAARDTAFKGVVPL